MVIDTSALIAILNQEEDAELFAMAIENDSIRLISAASLLETSIVLTVRFGEQAETDLDLLIQTAGIEIVPVTKEHVLLAREGFAKYGKSRHPARLNFGDCFSFALAKAAIQPLLFKGNDFSQTDVRRVVF